MNKIDAKSALLMVFVVALFLPLAAATAAVPRGTATEAKAQAALTFATLTPISTVTVRSADAPSSVEPEPKAVPVDASDGPSGYAELNLNWLAAGEADNVRWSLVRDGPREDEVYGAGAVDWAALRGIATQGVIPLPAGARWSFNDTFAGARGYKQASGILAGGHCALATVFRAAAARAFLYVEWKQHKTAIPGYSLEESVNIYWARDDLKVINTTGVDLWFLWELDAGKVAVKLGQTFGGQLVRVSRYDPRLGPPNCARWNEQKKYCESGMSSGLRWEDQYGVACACPPEWPFWTEVKLLDYDWTFLCLDRGGAIKFLSDSIPWIDLLLEAPLVDHGMILEVELRFPMPEA